MKGKYSGLSHVITVGKPLTKNAKVYIFYLYTINKTPFNLRGLRITNRVRILSGSVSTI